MVQSFVQIIVEKVPRILGSNWADDSDDSYSSLIVEKFILLEFIRVCEMQFSKQTNKESRILCFYHGPMIRD